MTCLGTSARIRVVIAALVIAAGIGACRVVARAEWPSVRPSLVMPPPIVMKLRRTCVACPNYTITLTSDGKLVYEGAEYTRIPGTRIFFVDARTVTDLVADFTYSEFLDFENVYPSPGAERMMVTLSVEMNGFSKAVLSEDRYGPAQLLELERKMDDLPGMRALSGWTH